MILKGIQRRMIIVKTDRSDIFEVAYLVLRNGIGNDSDSCEDMLAEANRIVNGTDTRKRKKALKKKISKSAAFGYFLLGIFFGASVGLLVYSLTALNTALL